MLRAPVWFPALATFLLSAPAIAGDFDQQGDYSPDPAATVHVGFGNDFDPALDRYLPDDVEPTCTLPAFEIIAAADALDGVHYLHVNASIEQGCAERFLFSLPATQASYRASVWVRHGVADAQINVSYPEGSGLDNVAVKMGPTGRVTSDGWIELASNPFPVNGPEVDVAYLRVLDFDSQGSDIDALELVPDGAYEETTACSGVRDPICGDGQLCIHERCRIGRLYVPPAPSDQLRNDMVSAMQSQLRVFFGGRKTRLSNMPEAIAILDGIRHTRDGWEFWNGWATAVRSLHDWHTRASGSIHGIQRKRRLNVCFIEGDADDSQSVWPSHASYPDLLVSHVSETNTAGLVAGDRLVAIDGMHPIEWALSLRDVDWDYWSADDDVGWAEIAERLRGTITELAHDFTVVRCSGGICSEPETLLVTDLGLSTGGFGGIACDNRPFYHLVDDVPPANHQVSYDFFRGRVEGTTEEEAIYAMVWDTLYGDGNPRGFVNSEISAAITDFKANARGVILDHRAGNGGTLDAAENVTRLVRPPDTVLVFNSPLALASFDGPSDASEGIAIFQALENSDGMHVGSADHDPELPVALIIHRDGSASDFMPFGMKGAPKTRLFGPHPTAGAFSTFYNYSYWGGLSWQAATGDSIAADGSTLIGYGVVPDEVILPRQSDLYAGLDTLHEAALAWVRQELKP